MSEQAVSAFDRLAAVMGREATLALIAKFGGRQIYIRPSPQTRIIEAIGVNAYLLVSRRFAGKKITVPMREAPAREQMKQRAQRVRELFGQLDKTVGEIAAELGIRERTVAVFYARKKGKAEKLRAGLDESLRELQAVARPGGKR
jgi:hypothetical protein